MSDNYENPDQIPENETQNEHTETDPSSDAPRGAYYSEYDEYRFRTPEGYSPEPRYPREPEKRETSGILIFFAVLGIVVAIAVASLFLYAGLTKRSVQDTVRSFFNSQPVRQPEKNIVFGRQSDSESKSSVASDSSGAAAGENAEAGEGTGGASLTENEEPAEGQTKGGKSEESQPAEDRTAGAQSKENQLAEDRTAGVQSKEKQPAEDQTKEANRKEELTIPDIVKETMPSMVSITNMKVNEYRDFFGTTKQYEGTSAGSGIIVGKSDTDLLIVTNDHVISHSSDITVTFNDDTSLAGEVKGRDVDNDLAIIGIPFSRIPKKTQDAISIIAIGNTDDLEVGESVVAIGNALGYGQTVSAGIVSAVNCVIKDTDGNLYNLIQTDASINPGNSGGALLNMRGELIGINESKYVGTLVEGVGYAIPMSVAMPTLEKIGLRMSKSQVNDENASYLGITCLSVPTEYLAKGYPEGVYVLEIEKGGPADKGGLLEGDIIAALGGVPVPTQEDLIEELTYYAAGEKVPVSVSRFNDRTGKFEKVSLEITLGNRANMTIELPHADSEHEDRVPESEASAPSEQAAPESEETISEETISEETLSEANEAASSGQAAPGRGETISKATEAESFKGSGSESEEVVSEATEAAESEKATSEPGLSETKLTMSSGAGETKVEASGSEKEGIPGADYSKRGQS